MCTVALKNECPIYRRENSITLFTGTLEINSIVKLKRIKEPSLKFLSLNWNTANIVIGRLQAGQSQNEVARTLNVFLQSVSMQSVPNITDVVSSNLDQGEVYNIMW